MGGRAYVPDTERNNEPYDTLVECAPVENTLWVNIGVRQ